MGGNGPNHNSKVLCPRGSNPSPSRLRGGSDSDEVPERQINAIDTYAFDTISNAFTKAGHNKICGRRFKTRQGQIYFA